MLRYYILSTSFQRNPPFIEQQPIGDTEGTVLIYTRNTIWPVKSPSDLWLGKLTDFAFFNSKNCFNLRIVTPAIIDEINLIHPNPNPNAIRVSDCPISH